MDTLQCNGAAAGGTLPPSEPDLLEPAVARGFDFLPCPRCGDDTVMQLSLYDAEGLDAVQCGACRRTFSLDDIRSILLRWPAVLAWLEAAPCFSAAEDDVIDEEDFEAEEEQGHD